ncbi:MAG: transporter substrate-binding domain-containing protein, partial [bacterium]|nr:transporter substrate-binding domain-containing protein [bacterium]
MATLLVAGSILPAAFSAESGSLARIRDRGRLIVGSNMVFPTLNFPNPTTGRNDGFMADLGRAVAKQLLGDEAKIEFHKTGEDTRFDDVNKGVVDVLIDTIPVSEEKLKIVDFSSETFVSGSALLVKAGSPIKTIDDIKAGTRVAYGSANPDVKLIKAKSPGATYLEFEKSPEAVAALKEGKA